VKKGFKHWTAESPEALKYAIASDFICQLQNKMDADGTSQKDVAKKIGKSEGYISQVINRPGNLTLKTMVDLARAVGLKVSIVAYEDETGDKTGPVISQIFETCWEKAGKPRDLFGFPDFQETSEE